MTTHEISSLIAIGRFNDGVQICTADLMFYGASVYGLRNLENRGFVDGMKIRNGGKWWRITPAGRKALEEAGDA